jgi:transcriptional regulator
MCHTFQVYTPAPFAESRPDVLHALIREYPLGLLISSSEPDGLMATHLPMLLDESNRTLRCHMARSNPHGQILKASPPVLVVFRGPEHYVTPSWYASKTEHGKVVPTWNYVAVHVRGRAGVFEDPDALLEHVRLLTAFNESSFDPAWRVSDAPGDYVTGLVSAIVGVEIAVEGIEGKWKLSQNRPIEDRDGVIAGLEDLGTYRSLATADEMKKRT